MAIITTTARLAAADLLLEQRIVNETVIVTDEHGERIHRLAQDLDSNAMTCVLAFYEPGYKKGRWLDDHHKLTITRVEKSIRLLKDFKPIEEYGIEIKAGAVGTLVDDLFTDSVLVDFPGLSDWYWIPRSHIEIN